MFCGYISGGSQLRCLCTDAYYQSGLYCVSKVSYGSVCTNSNQCLNNLSQTCSTISPFKCGCANGKYLSPNDSTCQYLKYLGDKCNIGSECWSGTCTALTCL